MFPPDALPAQLLPVLDRLVQILNERQVTYALIGGLGVALRGPLRATRDIDLLIKIPQLELPGVLTALVQGGFLIDIPQALQVWQRDHLLDFSSSSVRVDWLKPVLPAFEQILGRARWEQVGGQRVCVADAEGLILLKLIAFRARDQEDIKGMLTANSGTLDLDWVRREWLQLAGDGDPKTEQFEQWVSAFYQLPDSFG